MANVNSPFGLAPIGTLSGSAWSGRGTVYTIPSSDGTKAGIGDPILTLGTGTTNTDGTVTPDCKIAATTDVCSGVIVAILPDTRDSTIYRVASTLRRVLVCDDPEALFVVQEGTGGTALTSSKINQNISIGGTGSVSTTTGRSAVYIDNSTVNTTNTLMMKIVGFYPAPDNAIGDSCRWIVKINRSRFADQLAGV
jgi:hypothetical protein